jgi:hypothetical protein
VQFPLNQLNFPEKRAEFVRPLILDANAGKSARFPTKFRRYNVPRAEFVRGFCDSSEVYEKSVRKLCGTIRVSIEKHQFHKDFAQNRSVEHI